MNLNADRFDLARRLLVEAEFAARRELYSAAAKRLRDRSAKLRLFDCIMTRAVALTRAAATGDGDIESAVTYARYAAHSVFTLRLVPYGPEPERRR